LRKHPPTTPPIHRPRPARPAHRPPQARPAHRPRRLRRTHPRKHPPRHRRTRLHKHRPPPLRGPPLPRVPRPTTPHRTRKAAVTARAQGGPTLPPHPAGPTGATLRAAHPPAAPTSRPCLVTTPTCHKL